MSKTHDQIKAHSVISFHMSRILEVLGCKSDDPNFDETPWRVANILMEEMYPIEEPDRLKTTFPKEHEKGQMVIVKNHHAWSRCPHHLERVRYVTTIGYIPNDLYLGISKLPRIADYCAHGAVLQETYTENIAEFIMNALSPMGVAVMVTGDHQCMQCRGVQTDAHMITSSLRGVFFEKQQVREEFLLLAVHQRTV